MLNEYTVISNTEYLTILETGKHAGQSSKSFFKGFKYLGGKSLFHFFIINFA